MYRVYCNGKTLYDPDIDGLTIQKAKIKLELGTSGLFEFVIYPNHPYFNEVIPMLAMISVERNNKSIYHGRVLNLKYGFYGEKQVSCEGELAFLLDSMIEPHVYNGTFTGYMDFILDKHNSQVESTKQFVAGAITVGDFYPFIVEEKFEYKSGYDSINKMVAQSGGYLQVRYEDGTRYLDLLSYQADYTVSEQTIEVGKNLIDISRATNNDKVFSSIVPLGAKIEDTELRVDIKSVNTGSPYIVNNAAAAQYGRIYRQVIFDKITDPQTLLDTATDWLANNYAGEYSIELTAADLPGIDVEIDGFKIGQWVRVINPYHFPYDETFLIKKMDIDLLNPGGTKIYIGEVRKGISGAVAGLSGEINGVAGAVSQVAQSVSGIEVPEAQQPYLLSNGTTGIWKWATYSDGTCEFFGKISVTDAAVTSALGGWYKGASLYEATDYPYPLTMTEAPAIEMMFQTRNAQGALLWVFSQDAETAQKYLPQCNLIRPTTASGINGNINIIGRGKL